MKTAYKLIIAVVILAAVAGGGWYAWQMQSGNELADLAKDAGAKITDEQVALLVGRIGRFMVVPDEKPSVVVIRNAAELANQQPFYRGAKDGDFLVVYTNRAIIYDPVGNKLVNVGPIVQNTASPSPAPVASGSAQLSPSPSTSTAPAVPENVKVDVRNGTSTAGLAGSTASNLKKNAWVTIGVVGDAVGAYGKTVVIDLSGGKKPGAVAELARLLSADTASALPKGEASSTADILVIIGK